MPLFDIRPCTIVLGPKGVRKLELASTSGPDVVQGPERQTVSSDPCGLPRLHPCRARCAPASSSQANGTNGARSPTEPAAIGHRPLCHHLAARDLQRRRLAGERGLSRTEPKQNPSASSTACAARMRQRSRQGGHRWTNPSRAPACPAQKKKSGRTCRSTAPSIHFKSLRSAEVDSLGATRVCFSVEVDALTFGQCAHTGRFDRGRMDENVLAAAVRRAIKPKPLVALKNFTVPVFRPFSFIPCNKAVCARATCQDAMKSMNNA